MNQQLLDAAVKFMRRNDAERALDCIENMQSEVDNLPSFRDEYKEVRKVVLAFRSSMKKLISDGIDTQKYYELLHRSYIITAQSSFDDFMIALEWYRQPAEKFWLPRREKLVPICTALQSLEDGELKELFISQPPRTGKTTLVTFFILWIMCRDSERSNLYCSYADAVADSFYDGIIEIINDPVNYDLKAIFPKFSVASTDGKEHLLNIGRRKKYASLSSRSLYGALNGMVDCSGYVIGDDLHSGIEEATNRMLLDKAWSRVENNLIPRCKDTARMLWIGTRWSVYDCIARRLELLETDAKFKSRKYAVVNVPALDKYDESNFDYLYGVGFSTDTYHQRRSSFEKSDDIASWLAQYMGSPVERLGALFSPDALRYYNGVLPTDDPDRIFIVVDPAWGGGDYVAAPLVYQYGTDLYIADVVYDNGDKTITEPLIVQMAMKHDAAAIYVEATKTTSAYAEEIDKRLQEKGRKLNIITTTKHWTNTGKEQRIFDKAPEIKERMVFLDNGNRPKEYQKFMQNVYSFTIEGKNKHDDAPDSLAMILANISKRDNKIKLYDYSIFG